MESPFPEAMVSRGRGESKHTEGELPAHATVWKFPWSTLDEAGLFNRIEHWALGEAA